MRVRNNVLCLHFRPAKNQLGKIVLNVSGVEIFSDANPYKANVLFGRIKSDSLQQIADGIMEYFIAEGYKFLFDLFAIDKVNCF